MKNKKFYVLSLIIPIIMLSLIFLSKGFLTGNYSLLQSDLYHQYYQLFINLADILTGNSSLFYSFKVGLGQSFISTFSYYLASPVNLLLLLFNNVETAINFIILLKIGLCGLFMFTFLKYHFKKENSILLVFSTAYALSAQVINNYFNIMWLDSYFLSPLILLGIDKLIDEKNSVLYFITLFLNITINYYMGYMTCIFSVLYFIYKLFLKYNLKDKKEIKERLIKFIIVSILAGISSMFINIPNIINLSNISRSGTETIYTNDLDILLNLSQFFTFTQSFEKFLNLNFVYFYSGIFVFILFILYFFNKNINKKEKIFSLCFILILLLSITTKLNIVWHGFSSPIGFNFRYYYLFLILIIYISCKSFLNSSEYNKKYYLYIILGYFLLGIILFLVKQINLISLILSITFIIIYSLLIYFYNKKTKFMLLIKLSIILITILELYFNIYNAFGTNRFFENLYVDYKYNNKVQILEKIKNDDLMFYRMEFSDSLPNDSMLYNYNSLTAWYSTLNGNLVNFMKKIGLTTSLNMYGYKNFVITDTIFGLKYLVTDVDIEEYNNIANIPLILYDYEKNKEIVYNNYIYENPYALSLGFMVSNNVLNGLECTDRYLCQNKIINDMSSINDKYFIKENVYKIDEYNYKFEIEDKNDFIIAIKVESLSDSEYTYDVYLNDSLLIEKKISNSYNVYNFKSSVEEGTELTINLKNIVGDIKVESVGVYYKQMEAFEKNYNELSKNQLNLIDISDGYVKGTVDVTDDKNILFLSIPYENGWKVKVDGKETDIISIYDTFIGLKLESGTHEIEFIYTPPGLKIGIIISIVSISLYGMYLFFEKKIKNCYFN